MNFKSLPNGMSDGFCMIKMLEKKMTVKGKPYLDLILSDASGEISAKLWDFDEVQHGALGVNMIVKIRGTLEMYKDKQQFRVAQIRGITPGDDVDTNEIIRSAPYDGSWMLGELYQVVDRFQDEHLKELVKYLLAARGEALLTEPAALSLHHAFRGGLLYHTLSIVRMAEKTVEVYPFVDGDLLISGAILHDLAKLDELEIGEHGTASKYTVQGNLLGHLVKGAIDIQKAAETLGTPHETMVLLQHMVISHHGDPQFGAAVRPLFIEAELLSELDLMDARLYEMNNAIQNLETGEFSQRQWALDDRKIYQHGRRNAPTSDAKLDE